MSSQKPSSVIGDHTDAFSYEKMRSEFCIAVGSEFGIELDLAEEVTPVDYDNTAGEIFDAINSYMAHWLFNAFSEHSPDFKLAPYPIHIDVAMIAQELMHAHGKKISPVGKPDQFLQLKISPDETQHDIESRVMDALHSAIEVMMGSYIELDGMMPKNGKTR